jgi:hypothetical protein
VNTETELYNGSSWTEVNNLNTGRTALSGIGIVTAALAFGGEGGGKQATTESWNGTNWTEVNDLNTARSSIAGNGLLPTAQAYGGNTGSVVGNTEEWNGTNWAEVADLNVARQNCTKASASTLGLAVSGNSPPGNLTAVEQWSGSSTVTKTVSTD